MPDAVLGIRIPTTKLFYKIRNPKVNDNSPGNFLRTRTHHGIVHTVTQICSINMFYVILLFASSSTITCEWVEISQTYHVPTRLKQNDGRVTETLLYRNQTTAPWTKATINKVSNIGNVRKVPHASVKIPSRPYPDDIESLEPYQLKRPEGNNRYVNESLQKSPETLLSNTKDDDHLFTTTSTHFASTVDKSTKGSHIKSSQGIRRIYIQQINKSPLQSNWDIPDSTIPSTTEMLPVNMDTPEPLVQEYNEKLPNTTLNLHNQAQENDLRDDSVIYKNIEGQETKMDGIWKAVKVVAETIAKHSRKSLNGKLKYLRDLKETIIYSIEDQIDRVWPDDSRRSARSAEHHVEIPSSESALMTISFLTFAVFLIKLVLQVIHTYKHKAMMVSPTVLAAVGRTATAFKRNHL